VYLSIKAFFSEGRQNLFSGLLSSVDVAPATATSDIC
jgi:hypothetical protein